MKLDLPEQIERAIAARRLFARGDSILVAVSGGMDSMVLLHLLAQLAGRNKWRLAVAHFNHQLRGRGSDADERLVQRTAKKLGLRFVAGSGDVRSFARKQKLSLEMAARQLRHEFLARTARELRIGRIALAHHADDQVELFFVRLLRGAGGEGLAGMKWLGASPVNARIKLVRPLLDQPKAVLAAYAKTARVPFREDASNADLDIQRNRIRHELLPLLTKHYQPALARVVLRQMEIVGAEAEHVTEATKAWLAAQSNSVDRSLSTSEEPRTPGISIAHDKPESGRDGALRRPRRVVAAQRTWQSVHPSTSVPPSLTRSGTSQRRLSQNSESSSSPHEERMGRGLRRGESPTRARLLSPALSSIGWRRGRKLRRSGLLRQSQRDVPTAFEMLPSALQRRSVQLQLAEIGLAANFDLVEQLREQPGQAVTIRLGVTVSRDAAGRVSVSESGSSGFDDRAVSVRLKGRAGEISFEKARISWQLRKVSGGTFRAPTRQVNCECFDADKLGTDIVLRHWQPGDRFQPIGMAAPAKLQDLFTNQKIARAKRRGLLVGAVAAGGIFWVEGLRLGEQFKLDKSTRYQLKWRWERLC